MFQLTRDEAANLKSQFVTSSLATQAEAAILKSQTVISSSGWGGQRFSPRYRVPVMRAGDPTVHRRSPVRRARASLASAT